MDNIARAYFAAQLEEGMALAAESDIVSLLPLSPQLYIAGFNCKGLVRYGRGSVAEAEHFEVGIRFPDDYQRRPPYDGEIVSWLGPPEVFHPNIAGHNQLICIGPIEPGTPLVDLLFRTFEVVSYTNFTPVEYNALNLEACQWARRNLDRFPVDTRPLKWRAQAGPGVAGLEATT